MFLSQQESCRPALRTVVFSVLSYLCCGIKYEGKERGPGVFVLSKDASREFPRNTSTRNPYKGCRSDKHSGHECSWKKVPNGLCKPAALVPARLDDHSLHTVVFSWLSMSYIRFEGTVP
ncbi:hypothetical protein BKA67DRAFT_529838 [Truncatella angustata]|uniref:Uncharacterized protein n=1 Tax=Truncatella angustata TaxID=152316 RepID=A0A9P8UWM3_9PEZI|nr:uncharacterized protein BKA67DRAFT_529838 [Truncatella angustata]KAH6659697.1 hypothetical protein BKA67DRAFT_529838 [Truncatella angustata]